MALHCLYRSDAATLAGLRECLSPGDAVLLLGAAVCTSPAQLRLEGATIFALAEDAAAHGRTFQNEDVCCIDYPAWVELSTEHRLQQVWA